MKGLNICIIGSGSSYTPELIKGFIERKDRMYLNELRLMDIDSERLEILGNMTQRMLNAAGMKTRITMSTDLAELLPEVDFVLSQIRVGGLEARHIDETIPLKYGLLGQETTGIGGMLKGLRTIPVLLDIAKQIEKTAPDAWLINFSNPSGMAAEALLNYSSVKTIGLCNGPYNMLRQAGALVPDGTKNFDYSFIGLNHLCWITELLVDGHDLMPELLSRGIQLEGLKNVPSVNYEADILQAMGGLPISYLNYYLYRNRQIEKCKAATESRAEICMRTEKALLEMYSDPNRTQAPEELSQRGGAFYSEAAVSLIESMVLNDGKTHIVDTKNNGAIPFLDDDDVVEIKTSVTREGILPQDYPGKVSPYIRSSMLTVKAYEKLAVQAAIEGSYDKALQAALIHPLGGDVDAVRAALNELLNSHREFLPRFNTWFKLNGYSCNE